MESFADIVTREFRWPKKGDQAFGVSGNWQRNARVATGVHDRLVIMMTGYKAAADLPVEKSQRSGFDRDTLVYPIVFTYRQVIELELKYLIATYGFTVGIKANWKSHDIAFLWSEFVKVLAEFPSAVEAVRAAVQFQTRIKGLTISEVEDRRIAFRVGVNIGDVIVEPHDIFGDGVNIAARLECIAEPRRNLHLVCCLRSSPRQGRG
jgi:hypothetical protein